MFDPRPDIRIAILGFVIVARKITQGSERRKGTINQTSRVSDNKKAHRPASEPMRSLGTDWFFPLEDQF
jgi:hypothetical protein